MTEFSGLTNDDLRPDYEATYRVKFTPATNLYAGNKITLTAPANIDLTKTASCTVTPVSLSNVGGSP